MEFDPSVAAAPGQAPNPVSTGGGGERFEQRVGAYALALLLTKSTAPVLSDSVVAQVHFQTRRLGWRTDDLLIVGHDGGARRQLAIQAKRTFTMSASDEACVDTVEAMWDDFRAGDRFDWTTDRLAVATLHGTNTVLGDLVSL